MPRKKGPKEFEELPKPLKDEILATRKSAKDYERTRSAEISEDQREFEEIMEEFSEEATEFPGLEDDE